MLEGFTPLSLALLAMGSLAIFFGKRTWVLPVFLCLSLFVSFGPRVIIAGQNFMVYRVLLIIAWSRALMKGEAKGLVARPMDSIFIAFNVWTILGDTLLLGTSEAFIYQVANCLYDRIGIYYLARCYLRDREDYFNLIKTLGGLTVLLGACMTSEYITKRTFLDALGALPFVQVRLGRMRCQAAFGVPITAGTFGAVLFPLFVACWWQEKSLKKWAIPGMLGATAITLTAGSGGPLLAYVSAIAGMFAYKVRDRMRAVRWSFVGVVFALSLVMNAPVWFIIARLQVVPGASSYHRAKVVDAFATHFSDWWLLGVESTAEWGWEMVDVANQYLVVAKHGGLLALILFIWFIWRAFVEVGKLRRTTEDFPTEILIWSVGVMFFAHCVSFIGISYFDQMKVFWSVALAMITALPIVFRPNEEETVDEQSLAQTPSSLHSYSIQNGA